MKILIISQDAGSPGYGMVYRNYNLAREFVEMGHSVTIVSASFSHSRLKQPDVKKENIDGVDFLWIPVVKNKKGKKFLRVLNMFVFNIGVLFVKKDDWDVVIASSPNPFCIYPGYLISKIKKSILIFDIRDLWPLTLLSLMNVSKNNPLIYLMQKAEDFACRNSDIVLSVPSKAKNYLKRRGMKDEKFLHVPNGIKFEDITIIEKLPQTHDSVILDVDHNKKMFIGYCGTLGQATNIGLLLEALGSPKCFGVHLFILGDGPEKQSLMEKTYTLDISDRVCFLTPVNRFQARDFLSKMDVAYIGLKDSEVFKWGVSPTKINDYFLACCPIIYAVNDGDTPFENENCMVRCSPSSKEELIDAMVFFREMSFYNRKKMGENGMNWLMKNMDIKSHANTIIDKINIAR